MLSSRMTFLYEHSIKKPGNIKEANKQAKIYVGGCLTLHIFCFKLFIIRMNYVITLLLLVSCMSTNNHPGFVQGQP